ncbi:jerky protein homolog-like [Aedes albopictus]|uniref:HTH CENPB-type domain-containing protein n=1 Tax=Aedes albopictus TaxID=7160 RepID=A0ABM1YRG1_AEDAL
MEKQQQTGQKRKKVDIPIAKKLQIIDDLENGMSTKEVMVKHNISSRSTVTSIRQSKQKIREQASQSHHAIGKRMRFKMPRYPKVDEALFIWFLQKRQQHVPVSQEMLQVQAQTFFNKIVGEGEFGSRGYIEKFIQRHEIRVLKITGEKLSSNVAAIEGYVQNFSKKVRDKQLSPCQIFNADESGLFFKNTPTSTYVDKGATSAPGRKVAKERVTFMPCSNMDGSLKLPLMLIGKSQKPRALKHVRQLPVYYKASKNAWMTQFLFKNWFFDEFVPRVTKFLEDSNLPVEAVLVLDNCSAHFTGGDLQTRDGKIWTEFLPPNTTAIVQPMDQNIIQMIKLRYRKTLMQEMMGRPGDFHENVKNIKDAMFWVAEAWDSVPLDAIRKSWNMLYDPVQIEDEDDEPFSVLREKLQNISKKLLENRAVDEEDEDCEVLKDDDIVDSVLNPDKDINSYNLADSTLSAAEDVNCSIDTVNLEGAPDDDDTPVVTDEAAINGLNLVFKYAEENGWSINTQFRLHQMRLDIFEKTAGARLSH